MPKHKTLVSEITGYFDKVKEKVESMDPKFPFTPNGTKHLLERMELDICEMLDKWDIDNLRRKEE